MNSTALLPISISDSCCKDRATIKEVFGEKVRVVLDSFHALQRVVRTVKKGDMIKEKKKGVRIMFFRKLRKVFRRKSDQGKERQEPTAEAQEIVANIDSLLSEFSDHLRTETVKELEKLKKRHSACLANVPVKVGTQKNEGKIFVKFSFLFFY